MLSTIIFALAGATALLGHSILIAGLLKLIAARGRRRRYTEEKACGIMLLGASMVALSAIVVVAFTM